MLWAGKYKPKDRMPDITRTQHTLPGDVADAFARIAPETRNAYIVALRTRGWTLQSIAEASGLTRERVRQLSQAEDVQTRYANGLPMPTPPLKPERKPVEYIEPSPETLAKLLELQPEAQKVRGNGKAHREVAEEYTRLLNYAHTVEGVTLYRLAKRLGVTHGALRFRLARYGYKTFSGNSRVYKPITEKNRAL